MLSKIFKIGFILLFSVNAFAGKIDKAYEALKIYDYFKAKSLFQEVLEDEPIAARYGLTIIYYRSDNPFHNLDTAYAYIQKIEVDFEDLKSKGQKKLLEFEIDKDHISKLHNDILLAFWNNVKDTKNVRLFNAFIVKFPDFYDIENVKRLRTDLAYNKAVELNSFQSYRGFYETYPDDPRSAEAKTIYEKKLYEAKTADNNLQSYIDFIYIYPENPYAKDAEEKIFLLATKSRTAKSYKWFVDKFPKNPHAEEAWKNLFVLSFTDFNDQEIGKFIRDNHNFPYPDLLRESRILRDVELYQISKEDKWGYIGVDGKVEIEPKYEFENNFSNEYALVANEVFVGYIDKTGKQVIGFIYDDGGNFINGVANVTRGDSIALINKLGDIVLDFNYSEMYDAKDGVVLAKKKNGGDYVYLDVLGKNIFGDKEFKYAEPFKQGYAIVGDGVNFGIINSKGATVVNIDNEKIIRDTDDIFRIKDSTSLFGLVSLATQDTIIPFNFEEIGNVSEGYYPVFKEGKYGYYKDDGTVATELAFSRFKGDTKKVGFKSGFAYTIKRGKYGIIDTLGKKVFPNIFENIGEVGVFPIPCKKRGKWGYVTKRITMWLPYKYSFAGAFDKGQAIVAKSGNYGVINKRKKVVISFKYDKLTSFRGDYYLAVKDDKIGIIDRKGKIILPFYYSNVKEFKDDILILTYKDETYYYHLDSKIFLYGSFPKKSN